MKIKSLTLFNVGPYKTKSHFVFDYKKDKKINLIGGKNGAGKTTLFKSLKFCLYGAKALGYEVNNSNYYKEIKSLLNVNNILSNDSFAEVTATISLENSTNLDDYTIRRIWSIKNDKIAEDVEVYYGNQILNSIEQIDFENYMVQLIAPELFNFYFFNGEKIFESLFDERSMNNFKSSFVKIIGLDTIDIMIENFKRHADEKIKNEKLANQYNKAKEIYKNLKLQKELGEAEILECETEIKELETTLIELRKKYSKNRVLSITQKNELINKLKFLEEEKEKYRKFLKDCANNVIPFIILKEKMKTLLSHLKSESTSINIDDVKNIFKSVEIKTFLAKKIKGSLDLFIDGFVDSLNTVGKDNYLKISSLDKNYLIDQITNILNDERIDEIVNVEKLFIDYQDQIRSIKLVLNDNSSERNEEYYSKEIEITNKIIENQKKLEQFNKNLVPVNEKYMGALSEYLKVKNIYEEELKRESVSSLSIRASKEFSKMREKIIKIKIDELKKLFLYNFNNLINKKQLLSGIEVDENLSVYPYKKVKLSNIDVQNILKSTNKNFIVEHYGDDGYKKMCQIGTKKTIFVNEKILGTMSAGESQVYVVALYMSMLKLSNLDIPIIIDTPFGRIDEEHRYNLINSFIKKLDNEVIILSTNEEVIGQLYDDLKDSIATEYTVQNEPINGSMVKTGYFKEKKDGI